MSTKSSPKTLTMKAVCLHEFGGPEKLTYEEFPLPKVEKNQILVRVHAASVNPVDYKRGKGGFRKIYEDKLPWIPGGDFSGVVESIGNAQTQIKVKDSVYGSSPNGGSYAQFVSIDVGMLALKPRTLSHIQAASVPLAGQTAWQGLFKQGNLQKGQTVLIHGGAGGVGTFAIQMAKWKGAKVIATGSENSLQFLTSLGADQVIDYKKQAFEKVVKDVDLVFDLIGGDTQTRSFNVLKSGGYLIATADIPSEEKAKEHHVRAMWMHMKPSVKDLTDIAELIDAKAIKPIISQTYPLAKAQDAWKDIMSGHTKGKIVLIVEGS